MEIDFAGKRAIVCGGSRGIGRSIALGFAQAGAGVSICARGADALEAARREIERFGRKAMSRSATWRMPPLSGGISPRPQAPWAGSMSW